MPKLPVTMARKTFRKTSTTAEPTEPSAAIRFSRAASPSVSEGIVAIIRWRQPGNVPIKVQVRRAKWIGAGGNPISFSLRDTCCRISSTTKGGDAVNRRGQRFVFTLLLFVILPTFADAQGKPDALAPSPIPAKASKHVDKGVTALRAGNFKTARKELTAAYKIAPKNPDICYLLGVAYARAKDFEDGQDYLQMAVALAPENVPALLALGQLRDLNGDYARASELLEKAVALDPNQWLAAWVLADVEYRRGNYQKARQAAEDAVKLGEGAANRAAPIGGEALARLGRREDSEELFDTFSRDMPDDSAAPAARMFVAELQDSGSAASSVEEKNGATADGPAVPADATLPPFGILISTWGPSDVDQARPAVSKAVPCPVDQVIQGAGERVGELVENVNNINATEKVNYETLNAIGRATSSQRRSYDYLALISIMRTAYP